MKKPNGQWLYERAHRCGLYHLGIDWKQLSGFTKAQWRGFARAINAYAQKPKRSKR